jgi:hypothetical protein
LVDQETVLTRRKPRWVRVLQRAGVILALAAIVAGAVSAFSGGGNSLLVDLGITHPPTATPALTSNEVAVFSNVSYGTVTFNGKP